MTLHRWCIVETGTRQDGFAGAGESSAAVSLPPQLDHTHVVTDARHRVDTLRRCIHALDAQRVLVFMNYQQRLKVRAQRLTLVLGLFRSATRTTSNWVARETSLRRTSSESTFQQMAKHVRAPKHACCYPLSRHRTSATVSFDSHARQGTTAYRRG